MPFRNLALALLLCVLGVASVYAHPHVFADATIRAVFDEAGFAAVHNHWVYDELYSAGMMASADADQDGKLSNQEMLSIKSFILDPLAGSNYFNYVQCDVKFLKVDKIQNFKATFENNRLVLDFDAVFNAPAKNDYTMLVVVVGDPSNYVLVTSDMENSDVTSKANLDVEFFSDVVEGLTLFKAFPSDKDCMYIRYKNK